MCVYIYIYCLIDKHFPKSHKLHKIFNRNNLKVSYSCTTNMANIIKSHNQKILNENNEASDKKKCNCRSKNLCPLDGACLTKNIIYEATVTTSSGNAMTYIGMTEHEFKTRYNNHKLSFKDRKHSHATVLSKHIWKLKGWKHRLRDQLAHHQKGKRIQRQTISLQPMFS